MDAIGVALLVLAVLATACVAAAALLSTGALDLLAPGFAASLRRFEGASQSSWRAICTPSPKPGAPPSAPIFSIDGSCKEITNMIEAEYQDFKDRLEAAKGKLASIVEAQVAKARAEEQAKTADAVTAALAARDTNRADNLAAVGEGVSDIEAEINTLAPPAQADDTTTVTNVVDQAAVGDQAQV